MRIKYSRDNTVESMKMFGNLPFGSVFTLKNKENIYVKAQQSQHHAIPKDNSGHAVLLSGGKIFPMEFGRLVFEVEYNFVISGIK